MANTNTYAVRYFSSVPFGQMFSKRQNEQEVQSQLIGYIDGTSPKSKRLHWEKDETDSLYHYPTQTCDHDGFQSQRGCRKNVNTKHSWFFFFDEKPDQRELVASSKEIVDADKSSEIAKPLCRVSPSLSVSSQIGETFTKWLTGSGGGCGGGHG